MWRIFIDRQSNKEKNIASLEDNFLKIRIRFNWRPDLQNQKNGKKYAESSLKISRFTISDNCKNFFLFVAKGAQKW